MYVCMYKTKRFVQFSTLFLTDPTNNSLVCILLSGQFGDVEIDRTNLL